MVIHYSAAEGVACGRAGASLNSSAELAQVSCKLCLRSVEKKSAEPVRKTPSLAELRAAAKAAKSAQSTSMPAATSIAVTSTVKLDTKVEAKPSAEVRPATTVKVVAEVVEQTPGKSARGEWQQRLQQLPGRNRLPRGMSRQRFI